MPGPNSGDTALLVTSVREAGAIARKFFGGTYKSWNKSHGNPVTEADIAIDTFLKEKLRAARPGYGWLSEETADNPERLARERVFIVDPIDGTYGFLRGRPQFTIVAAVVEHGLAISGAVYNPITEEMFEATQSEGARCNGRAIHVTARAGFENARLLMEHRLMDSRLWATPWPDSLVAETRASAAYRMALVAAGAFDGMLSLSPKSDWDVAAGDLIVREANGRVTTAEGAPLIYNGATPLHPSVICGGSALHGRLLDRVQELLPG